jgi:GrpB-like predicted nucleotidyltransferase (UPF0157 family)
MPELFEAADYQALIEARYARLRDTLLARWPTARAEHVGASSIAGAVSKGDLDLLLLVASDAFEPVREQLVASGYTEKADTLRTAALCMLEAPDHALQLVASGSEHERVFLLFRDRLRADPDLLAAYNDVKRQHAADSDERYRAAKAEFIERVLGS